MYILNIFFFYFFFFFRYEYIIFFFFFFQAEDGIRDLYVTGVQTCALPICKLSSSSLLLGSRLRWCFPGRSRSHRKESSWSRKLRLTNRSRARPDARLSPSR